MNTGIKRFFSLRKGWYFLQTIFTSHFAFFYYLQYDNYIMIFKLNTQTHTYEYLSIYIKIVCVYMTNVI